MYQKKNITKIIWLSDIHLKSSYFVEKKDAINVNTKRIKEYFESFFNAISNEPDIDYFLISGDIAFSASMDDYDAFWKNFIEVLHQRFEEGKHPKIIILPGNHDVSWNNITPFTNYLEDYDSNDKKFIDRNKTLKNEEDLKEFLNSYKGYIKYFGENEENQKKKEWKDFFDLDIAYLNAFHEYKKNRLFGYLIDHKKEIIFIIINTSWYSIGSKFNEHIVSTFAVNPRPKHKEDYEKSIIDILDKKDKIIEYGNQIIGRELLKTIGIEEEIKKHPKYAIVTCMHHPLNWLNWHELYDFETSIEAGFTLDRILNKSDLLLTGHEHVPVSHKPERVYTNLRHLKAGMFIEDNIDVLEGNPIFEHCRFSILEISTQTQKPDFKETRLVYNKDNQTWENKLQVHKKLKYKKASIDADRKTLILNSFSRFDINGFLSLKLGGQFNCSKISETDAYDLYKDESKDLLRYCIIPKKIEFHEFLQPSYLKSSNLFDDLISKAPRLKKLKIHFVWLDFLIDNNLAKRYEERDADSDEIYHQICQRSDIEFNWFRHNYFVRFEPTKEGQVFDSESFKWARNLRFINDTIAFWMFERFANKWI